MKFVTGLEVILAKAQDWEQVAAKHVSLSTNLEALTQIIIQWRKLELGYETVFLTNVAFSNVAPLCCHCVFLCSSVVS